MEKKSSQKITVLEIFYTNMKTMIESLLRDPLAILLPVKSLTGISGKNTGKNGLVLCSLKNCKHCQIFCEICGEHLWQIPEMFGEIYV